jgi:hypothetical protein
MGRNCTQRLDWRAKMRPRVHLPPPKRPQTFLRFFSRSPNALTALPVMLSAKRSIVLVSRGVAEPPSPERSKLSSRRAVPNLSCLSPSHVHAIDCASANAVQTAEPAYNPRFGPKMQRLPGLLVSIFHQRLG